jgi:hypothetical protein
MPALASESLDIRRHALAAVRFASRSAAIANSLSVENDLKTMLSGPIR